MGLKTISGGLICAGRGKRFREAGVAAPKAMIALSGRPLLDWAVRQLWTAGIDRMTVIFNSENAPTCRRYLEQTFTQMHFTIICRDTATSFESFQAVLAAAPAGHVLITTVDAVYAPGRVAEFLRFARRLAPGSMALGVTGFIDDEKPLFATLAPDNRIVCIGAGKSRFVTSGIYWLPAAFARLGRGKHFAALRQYLAYLIGEGSPCFGFDMGKSIDIDRPADLAAAKAFVGTFS